MNRTPCVLIGIKIQVYRVLYGLELSCFPQKDYMLR
jgi:hypothetical protein